MLPYQEQYVSNVREIAALSSFYDTSAPDFEAWYEAHRAARTRMARLRAECIDLLNENLFPTLDELHSASEDTIASLEAFADQLMDWKTNLDCGVYVIIHDALLRFYRVRKERNSVIKELYKLGMGLYYKGRSYVGIENGWVDAFRFQNELAFTEAASYIRYFESIEDEETRGYIIRSLANTAICTRDMRRRIAVGRRILNIIRDEHYRALAPNLPWDVFLLRTHQQMSSNRKVLSRGNLTQDELATVLDSCYEVFKPQDGVNNPSIRWLWPYYEMEYSCGYVDLKTTLGRLEDLISRTDSSQYDMSGLYANVQLAVYYGRLMRDNPALQKDPNRVGFLDSASRKMRETLLTCPPEHFDDYFIYLIDLVFSDYFEMEGVPSYRELTTQLMQRFCGELYVRSRRAADMTRCFCSEIFRQEPAFFDDIPFLAAIDDPARKERALLAYAADCGLYHDFGLVKMNIERTMMSRQLFEDEFQFYQLHTISGRDDLRARKSTEAFADVAWGHHSWYNGAGGYPESYVRMDSPFRQMTDVVAVVSHMLDHFSGDIDATIREIVAEERRRFSPLVTVYLSDEALTGRLERLLRDEGRSYYKDIYDGLLARKA